MNDIQNALVEALRNSAPSRRLMLTAADEIETLENYEALYQELTDSGLKLARRLLTQFPAWIPVTDRLPEEKINPNTRDFEYVLCTTIWGDVRPFKYGTPIGQKEAHFWNGAGYVDAYVTHWMPLPDPPEEVEA